MHTQLFAMGMTTQYELKICETTQRHRLPSQFTLKEAEMQMSTLDSYLL